MMDVQLASLFASGAFIIIGLFAAIFIDNLIKKIIGIEVESCLSSCQA